ncbi:MAG TPA: ExeM/NucH family extracellular endonuclease, partial [Vitreimonas sp.]|nr:ExeM/NucH family extracellular endonuclease [Vitreimonas sp.]
MRPARRARRSVLAAAGSLLILAGLLPVAAAPVLAAGSNSLSALNTAYFESFDTLAFTGTSSVVPNGWAFTESGTNANTTYAAGTGSSNAGDTYSFGPDSSSDRAFGGLLSGSLIPTIGASFTNETGSTINTLAVAYTGEQWRLGATGREDRLDFQVSTNATSLTTGTWTNVDVLDFTAPATAGTVGALNGNSATNRTLVSASIGSLAIAPSDVFWIRWTDFNAAGADDGLAVDDFSITPSVQDAAPAVASTTPADGATGVPRNSSVSVTFTESVTLDSGAIDFGCTPAGPAASVDSGPATTFTLVLSGPLPAGATCTITVVGSKVHDVDEDDPPDTMAGTFSATFTVADPVVSSTDVKISEIYGGGGNSGATLTNDFIELYNRGTTSVSLAGWSVQYASSTGTSWQVTALAGSISPGRYYLIQQAAGTGGTTALPAPDATGTIAMAAGAGKVALVASTTALTGLCPTGGAIVDFVGYGSTANCFEGSGPTATLSNTTAAHRIDGGATDTDDNAADFTVGAPEPRNSAFVPDTGDAAPSVQSTTPANGAAGVALASNITVTFSEPVDVTGDWFTIACASSGVHTATVSGGPVTYTLDPDADFGSNESCTVTILAANVTDQDTEDPPDNMAANYVFSFQTFEALVCGDPATRIHEVQGGGATTPMGGVSVTIEGVVVGDYQLQLSEFGGFYLQEEDHDADNDAATSEGIFVFDNGFGVDVAPGEVVRVRGTAGEFFNLTQISAVSAVQICSSGASVTPIPVALPVSSIAVHERTEGMLVEFDQDLTATEVFSLGRFGEVSLSGVGRLYIPTAVTTPGANAIAKLAENNRSRIILDDGNNQQNIDPTRYPQGGLSASNTLRVGDTLTGLTGVMDFRFSNYRIQPVGPISWQATNPRTLAPEPVGGNLTVASFNVLNYFNGNGSGADGAAGGFPTARGANNLFEFNRQRDKIFSALAAIDADIVGLMEIENDPTPNSAIEDLVAGLNARMGAGTYAFIDTGIVGTDEIRVALIYKPAAVSPEGVHQILTSQVDPRFIDTRSRPALAQTFEKNTNGERLTVVVNHLKSKGSACPGDPDTGDGSGNCNGTRTQAAEALVDWLATDPTDSGDDDFLVIGDLNAYTFETPITTFTDAGYANLIRQFGGLEAYSYVFNGESGYLDHALASPSLAAQVTGATDWHINPDEPTVLDYNVEFKSANHVQTLYDPSPYRASDHDPVIVGLRLNAAPTVDAGGPYAVVEGGTVTVTAAGSDPDGDPLTYAWDLDNDGTFETSGQSATFSAVGLEAPLTLTIAVQVTDDGGLRGTNTTTVDVTWDFVAFAGPVRGRPHVERARAGQTL